MATKRLLCIGNSLTGGSFATDRKYTYVSQLFRMLKEQERQHDWQLIATEMSGATPTLGGAWLKWQTFRELRPDVICFQSGENDTSSTIASLAAAASSDAISLTFNASLPSENRAYKITGTGKEEIVIVRSRSTATSARTVRGAMGTTPQDWPADSVVEAWATKAATGFTSIMDACLRDIMNGLDYSPILLVGGYWFDEIGVPELGAVIDGIKADGHNTIEHVQYLDDAGAHIGSAANEYGQPAARLDGAIIDSDTTISLVDAVRINVGNYCLLAPPTGTPTAATCEVVLVTAKTGNDITITRAQLGSTARSFADEGRVCRMSPGSMPPRRPWATLGAAGFSDGDWGHDRHPNDLGFLQIAKSFLRGYNRVKARI